MDPATTLPAKPECDLSRYRGPTSAAFAVGHPDRRSVVNCNIFNSKGVHVGVVTGDAVFGLKGQKLYDLKGSNIYKLNGDLVGHLSDARGKEKRLDKTTDKLFPEG
jgi:sporulation protein YlmC with PRC-barrel domain